MSEFVWIFHEFPWVGRGFIHLARDETADLIRTKLRELRFALFELDGRQMSDAHSLHAELAREFGFPDYYGHNWDAFNDSFGDIEPSLPSPAAILWHHADVAAAGALKPYAECIHMLMRASEGMSAASEPKQLDLFLFGDGKQFPRP
jgi:RNAse (barnase) inhibitor barstar